MNECSVTHHQFESPRIPCACSREVCNVDEHRQGRGVRIPWFSNSATLYAERIGIGQGKPVGGLLVARDGRWGGVT